MPCRHILAVLVHVGEDPFNICYFHTRWMHRETLPEHGTTELLQLPNVCSECKVSVSPLQGFDSCTGDDHNFEFEGGEAFHPHETGLCFPSQKKTNQSLQKRTANELRAACDNLIFFASHNSEIGKIATNAVIHLEQTLRAGKMPVMQILDTTFESSVTDPLDVVGTIVSQPSSLLPGRPTSLGGKNKAPIQLTVQLGRVQFATDRAHANDVHTCAQSL